MIIQKYKGHRVNLATIEPLKKGDDYQIICITTGKKTHYFSISPNISIEWRETK